MSQHPIYYPDPIKNFKKLQEIISLMLDYAFISEEVWSVIDMLMQRIYMSQDEINEIENGSLESPSIDELFQITSNKEQFIQDYRNVISYCMQNNLWDIDFNESADQIIQMRDMEDYKNSIVDRK